MATAVAVGTWEGSGVRLGQVAAELGLLRRGASERAARAAVMTLVVVASTDEAAARAVDAVHAVVAHHPARVVVLRPEADAAATLDGRAELFRMVERPSAGPSETTPPAASSDEDVPVSFEEVTLAVGGQAAHHLDSLVDPFTLGDLPVVTWYPDGLPDAADDRLLSGSHTVLVDTRDTGDPIALRRLLELARRRVVVDLSWVRLESYRDLIAGLFDPAEYRPFCQDVTSARVAGKPGPRHLLGGWLLAQLGLAPRQVDLADARHVSIELHAAAHGRRAVFAVGRLDEPRGLWAGVRPASGGETRDGVLGREQEGGPLDVGGPPRQVAQLPDTSLPTTLASALSRMNSDDAIWARALAAAGNLAS